MKRPFEGELGLSYFCKNQSSFKAKFGAITLYKAHFRTWLEKILLTFEYLQLFSLTILLHPNIFLLSDANPDNTFIFKVVVYFFQMVNPSYLLSFERSDSTTYCVLAIIFGNIIFKYLMLFYIIYVTSFNKEPNSVIKTLWRWIVKLQGRAACCFVTSFWVRTIVNTTNDSWGIEGLGSRTVISIASLLIALEYIVSFLLETQICDFIPTNRYLSSKNYHMQVITLTQKLMIQFTQIFVNKNVEGSIWVCIVLNFVLGWVRGFRFYTTLPLYNYDSLLFQGDFIAVLFSLNIVHFFHHILRQANYSEETDFRFILVIWIVIGILSVKLSRAYLKQTYIELVTQTHDPSKGNNPDLLLHRIFATKHLIENTILPTSDPEKSDISHLLGITQTLNLSKIFNIKPIETSYDSFINDHEDTNQIFLEYLNQLLEKFPNNSLIKLNLAYQHFRSSKFHSKIIKITSKLNESLFSPYYLSSTLLLYNLELSTIAEFNTVEEKQKLDLINYMERQIFMQNLESEMLKQITLRKQICDSIIGDKPDLEKIYQNSQILHRSKISIQKKIKSFLKEAPGYDLRPILIFAEYSLYLNYSIADYHHYYENYSRKVSKFAKEFEANSLSEENLYDPGNAFLIISTENNSLVYLPKSLEDICGIDRNNYIGTPPTRLFPYGLRNYYAQIFKEIFEKGHTEFTNKVMPALLAHKEGYFIKADIFIRVHPFMSRNSYLDMVIRPHRTFNDAILLDSAGKIEGVTKDIAEFLGIHIHKTRSRLHIKEVSEELAKLNEDLVKSDDDQGSSSSSSSENKIIELFKPKLQKQVEETPLSLKCIVLSTDKTTYPLNLIRLQRISDKANPLENNSISSETSGSSESIEDLQEGEQINDLPPPSSRFWNPTTLNDEDISPELLPITTRANNLETEENLILPPSSRPLIKSKLALSPKRQQQKVTFSPSKIPLMGPKITDETLSKEQNLLNHNASVNDFSLISKIEPDDNSRYKTALSVGSQQSSKASHLISVFKTFQTAVNAKSYQRSFNALCLVFYGVILLTLVGQIILKRVLDNTMGNLIIKTDLLNYAQLRALHTTVLHNSALGLHLVIEGYIPSSDPYTSLPSNIVNMLASLEVMSEANRGIISHLNSESEETKQMLFQKDVEIKGNYFDWESPETQLLTHFQHTDLVTSAVEFLHQVGSTEPIGSAELDAANQVCLFLRQNLMDDFLFKNEEIIEAFQKSLNDQKDSLQLMIRLSAILLPILLAGIVSLLSVIIWIQYNREQRYLLAFLKLNPAKVKDTLENLEIFENKLTNKERFQAELVPKLVFRLEQSSQNYHKVHDLKIIKKSQMQKRYFGYIFRVLFYIFLLIIIVILNYIFITKATNQIYRKQRQIQYANEMSITTSVSYIAETETYASNNTNYIMRKPPLEIFEKQTEEIRQFQTNLYSEFKNENGEYDPEVYTVLFEGVSCDHLTYPYDTFCVTLHELGYSTELVSTLTILYNFMSKKIAQYPALDKSTYLSVLYAGLADLNYLNPSSRLSAINAQFINQAFRKKLTVSVNDLYDLGTTILTIFSITLVLVSLVIWFQILTKVREVNNDFKKVLAVLPPNIILSSFLLKSFLNKTSNMTQKL